MYSRLGHSSKNGSPSRAMGTIKSYTIRNSCGDKRSTIYQHHRRSTAKTGNYQLCHFPGFNYNSKRTIKTTKSNQLLIQERYLT